MTKRLRHALPSSECHRAMQPSNDAKVYRDDGLFCCSEKVTQLFQRKTEESTCATSARVGNESSSTGIVFVTGRQHGRLTDASKGSTKNGQPTDGIAGNGRTVFFMSPNLGWRDVSGTTVWCRSHVCECNWSPAALCDAFFVRFYAVTAAKMEWRSNQNEW